MILASVIGAVLFIAVICPMIYFTMREGVRYGDEIEGGRGGTHSPTTRKPWGGE